MILPPSPRVAVAEAELRLEALHVQPLVVPGPLEVLGERIEHVGRPGDERLAIAPVRAQPLEVVRSDPAVLAGQLFVQTEALVAVGEGAQLGPKITSSVWRAECSRTTSAKRRS